MVNVATAPASSSDYLGLVTTEHRTATNFMAMIDAIVSPLAGIQSALSGMPTDFDLDSAIGAQLDVVGEWVGWSRYIKTPITGVYFSFDDASLGWDKGVWKGPYDSDTGVTRLDDDTYRAFIRLKIAANNWDGTVASMKTVVQQAFSAEIGSFVAVYDNQDGSFDIAISQAFPSSIMIGMINYGYWPLKPDGYLLNWLMSSRTDTPIFGFDLENDYVSGFDSGSWAVTPQQYLDLGIGGDDYLFQDSGNIHAAQVI